MRVFDTSFDYKTDKPRKTKPDADRDSRKLRLDHQLLWTKKLNSGDFFKPTAPSVRRHDYLILKDTSEARHWYGSDAITASYTTWMRPKTLVNAIAELDGDQKSLYLNPPYTIGSSMIWPVRKKDRPTINQARGTNLLIGDRIDLTLECIRRHYAKEQGSPIATVTNAYGDFFGLFGDFKGFVEFFHFQDLVTPDSDYKQVEFFLPPNNFQRSGTPTTTPEYVHYRDKVLKFINKGTIGWPGGSGSTTLRLRFASSALAVPQLTRFSLGRGFAGATAASDMLSRQLSTTLKRGDPNGPEPPPPPNPQNTFPWTASD